MRCAHYALTPTTPVRAVRCRRRARLRVQVGARVWAVCAPCLGALRVLWGEGLREVGAAPAGQEPDRET